MPSSGTAKTKSARNAVPWLVVLIPALAVISLISWLVLAGKAGRQQESAVLKTKSDISYNLEVVDGMLAQGGDVPTGSYGLTDDFKNDVNSLPALARDRGILFEFQEEGKRCFSMNGMRFSLDIIWINKKKQVVHVGHNISHTSRNIYCHGDAMFVIKLNAGEAKRADIREKQTLAF